MSALTVTKFNDCTKPVTIRCASLSDRAPARARFRNETDGAPPARQFPKKDPRYPTSKRPVKGDGSV